MSISKERISHLNITPYDIITHLIEIFHNEDINKSGVNTDIRGKNFVLDFPEYLAEELIEAIKVFWNTPGESFDDRLNKMGLVLKDSCSTIE
ncbi:MAG: hypothetical protein NHB32_06755 [Fischerella sp. CENA71]|nr:hypothetical protein [Fischerella sp. CENA71]